MVLYQSARQADRSNVAVGYFATAIIEEVIVLPYDHLHVDIRVSKVEALSHPKVLLAGEKAFEPTLFSPSGALKGWSAAYDVREISIQQYRDITEGDTQTPFTGSPDVIVTVPRFQNHIRQIRDPEFRLMIYRAYGGRCAISGVELLYEGGFCGLIAAHIYPHSREIHHRVSGGILMDPTWHSRLDGGGLIIHDDYSWEPRPEDDLTRTIKHRFLRLPENEEDWPDKVLLARQRALFGR
ncbi:hypothetical protein DevBK_20005 [Devosia sp. BK]|uniref:HNH endonuclease n=1 Tax=Devosia sp. BK TaxID=2871706 RepID=UPI0029399D9C|nr:HNH endonuclease [Devosia sp. BK]MDV3253630.1 hypothetical protein [Devosia sp. BK]